MGHCQSQDEAARLDSSESLGGAERRANSLYLVPERLREQIAFQQAN
jgi:hypothetical protein